MKALSIKQPWAWLIIRPDVTDPDERANLYEDGLIKDIENRDWQHAPHFRGPLRIHASKSFDVEGYEYVQDHFPDIEMPKPNEFDMGGIVGEVRMTGCVSEDDCDEDSENDPTQSEWFFGPLGFVFEDAKPRPFVPMRGQLGFFEVPE